MRRVKFMKTGMGYVVPTQLGTSWRRKNINFHGWRVRILGSRNIVTYLCSQSIIHANNTHLGAFKAATKKETRHQSPQHLTNENENPIPCPGSCWWFRNPAVAPVKVGDFSYHPHPDLIWPNISSISIMNNYCWTCDICIHQYIRIYTQNVPSRESCCLETWIQKN